MGLLGALIYQGSGFPGRTAMRSVEEVLAHTQWSMDLLHSDMCQKYFTNLYPYCQLAQDAPPTMALVGDSFANAYFPGLAEEFSRRGENLAQLGRGGCPPLLDIEAIQEGKGVWCMNTTSNAIKETAALPGVHTVILAAQWHLYLVEEKHLNPDNGGPDNPPRLLRRLPPAEPGQTNIEVFDSQFRKTLDLLIQSGKKVIVIKQTPDLSFDPVACLVKRPMSLRENMACTLSAAEAKQYLAEYEVVLDGVLADYPTVKVLDPVDTFFPDGEIIISRDYIPLFRDKVPHLSYFGSRLVAGALVRQWP